MNAVDAILRPGAADRSLGPPAAIAGSQAQDMGSLPPGTT